MGLLSSLNSVVSLLTAGRSLLSQQRLWYTDLSSRVVIERARTELRLGNVARCDVLLASVARRLDAQPAAASEPPELPLAESPQPPSSGRPGPPRPEDALLPAGSGGPSASALAKRAVLRAVIISLRGQSMRARGRSDRAAELFQQAVDAFDEIDDDLLSPRDHGDFGIALAEVGKYKDARGQLEAAASAEAAPPEIARELAGVLLELKKYQRAEQLLDEALLALPADPQLYLLRAEVQEARGNPAAPETFTQAGHLLLDNGRADSALQAFERSERLRPGSYDVIGSRAEALRLLGRYDEAIAAFDQAIAGADGPLLRARRAAALASRQDWDRASADLERALQLAPEDLDVLLLVGEIRREQGDAEAAEQLAMNALAVEPGNWRASALAAGAKSDCGDLSGALDLLRSADAGSQGQPTLLRLRARLALAMGGRREAIEMLGRLESHGAANASDAFEYASVLADDGRAREALAAAERGLDAWPDDLGLRLLEVELRLAQGDRDTALSRARDVISHWPDQPAGQLLYAAALTAQPPPWDEATTRDALAAAARSAELDPKWAEPWWTRAQILRAIGDQEGVAAALAEVLSRDHDHRDARRLAVEMRLSAKELGLAEQLARELVAQVPDDADSLVLLARVLSASRRDTEALQLLMNPAVELTGPPEARAERLLFRAGLRTATYAYGDAAEDLAAAAELAPERFDVWNQRASVARYLRDGEAAKNYALQALALGPDDPEARLELIAVHLMQRDLDQAAPILEEMMQRWPEDVRVLLLHAQAIAAREPQRARAELAQLSDAHPQSPAVACAITQLELDTGNYQAALDALAGVPDADKDADVLALRSEAHRLAGRPGEAIREVTRCLELAPEHAAGLATLGLVLLDSGDEDRAVEVFERAVSAYPRDPVAKARLGEAYAVVDQFDEALRLLDEAAVAVPANTWVTSRLADALADVGLFDDAATLYQQICDGPEADAAAWNGLGWSLEFRDRSALDRAELAFQTAVELGDDMWSRQNLADIYYLRGQRDRARALFAELAEAALSRRAEHTDYLGLAAWCSFRLGDLEAAARGLHEATSAQKRTSGEHFDLALVHLCAGRIRRGVALYESIIPLIDRHPQRRRGLLAVALADLRQARLDFPDLSGEPEAERVLTLIGEALASVSAAPRIDALAEAVTPSAG